MTDKDRLYLSEPDSDEETSTDLPFFITYPRATNLMLLAVYAAVGVLYFATVLDWSAATAFYAVAQILTTVGYGDLPFADAKVFVTIYVLVGLAIVANVMNDIFNEVLDTAQDNFSKQMHRAREFFQAEESDSDAEPVPSRRWPLWRSFLYNLCTYFFLVFLWMLFRLTYEACSCSYGITAIEGCEEDKCVATGGSILTAGEAFYEAIITFATVGFGDYSPTTRLGRVLGALMMIFGVLAFGSLVGAIASLLDSFKDSYKKKLRVSPQVFRQMDLDGNGRIGKGEFRSYMLLREGKVSADLLATIDKLFDSIDRNNSGLLSFAEIHDAEKRASLYYEEGSS